MRGVWLLLILFALVGCGTGDAPPNVLLITIDTLRADRVASSAPFLTELASRGVHFENAYSTTS